MRGRRSDVHVDRRPKVLTLEAGPSWYWGDHHPLAPFVGKHVTVVGEQATGSTEVDVHSVDGTVVREPGKPPWAGGWKAVGKIHPGWTQEKADTWPRNRRPRRRKRASTAGRPATARDVHRPLPGAGWAGH